MSIPIDLTQQHIVESAIGKISIDFFEKNLPKNCVNLSKNVFLTHTQEFEKSSNSISTSNWLI